MEDNNLLDEIREEFNNPKPKKPAAPAKKRGLSWKTKLWLWLIGLLLIITGVATIAFYAVGWGAEHQFVRQPFVKQPLILQFIYRIEEVVPEVIISPIVEKFSTDDLTPIEEKIIERWGIKEGVIALAIAECESGRDQDTGELQTQEVSLTGDLGLMQINWHYNGDIIEDRFGYTPADMFDVDKNLDAAVLIWDRVDGKEGDGKGGWGDGVSTGWSTFNSGVYLNCLR